MQMGKRGNVGEMRMCSRFSERNLPNNMEFFTIKSG